MHFKGQESFHEATSFFLNQTNVSKALTLTAMLVFTLYTVFFLVYLEVESAREKVLKVEFRLHLSFHLRNSTYSLKYIIFNPYTVFSLV